MMNRFLLMSLLVSCLSCGSADGTHHDAFADGGPSSDGLPADGTGMPDALGTDVRPADLDGAAAELTGDVVVGDPVPLFVGGQSDYVVLLPEQASPSEQRAAEELQFHIEQCTGVMLPIVALPPTEETPAIVLGRYEATTELGIEPTDEELGPQGYALVTVPPHVVIAGTAGAGTLYGVHRFLEEFFDVRWYAPGATATPAAADVVLPPLNRIVRPAFMWRHTSYEWPGNDAAFYARQGDNNGGGTEESEWGLEYEHDGRAHSYFWYVSPDEFFDEHPEYFSEIGGVRVRDETQLCLTNPEVLDIVTERMLQRMADKPNALQHNFSQHDHYNYCTCPACAAMNEKYGTTGGTQFWFVSELAKRTAEVYPDKLIGTLAYTYTEEPPVDLEMHPNVAVWLCHMYPSCDAHPIATCPHNADYKRRAEAWATLTQHLYIWHYIVDFTHYYNPFPNFRAMAADMAFYRDLGVEGIYLQGMGHSGGGGEFSLLRPYYGMKLLWNPDVDPVALRRDFLEGYYQAAADSIEAYVEMLLDEVTDKDIHMHLYTNPGQGYLSDPVLAEANVHFDAAEAAVAGDEELLERVKVARMPLVYAQFFPRNGYTLSGGKVLWNGELAGATEVKEFLDRMTEHGFKTLREVGGDPSLLMLLYSIFAVPQPVNTLDNGLLQVSVVSQLGGRALRVTHLASGVKVTADNVIPNLFFPFAGGLEDRIGGAFEAYGWVEPAKASQESELKVTMTSTTLNGYQLQRTFTLEANAPVLHQETMLTNTTGKTREDRFRFHMELDLGDLATTQVQFTAVDGASVNKDMTDIIAGLREGEHYYDQDCPAGSWTFRGDKGLQLTQTFDNETFEYAWLYAYPASLNELEVELWAPKLHLEDGESVTFHHAIEIQPVP